MTDLGYNLQTGEMTHLQVSKRLVKTDPELIEMKREVITLHYHELVDGTVSAKRKRSSEVQLKDSGKKKKTKIETKPSLINKTSDGPVLNLMPLHNVNMNQETTASMHYQVNDKVLIYPEHVESGQLRQVVYGNVEGVNASSMTVKTRNTHSTKSTTVVINLRRFNPINVSNTEFNGLRTGLWLRKAVLIVTLPGVYLSGQVIGYNFKPVALRVHAKAGIEEYRVEEVIEIPGPLGIILFNANYSTKTRLEEVHLELPVLMEHIKGSEERE